MPVLAICIFICTVAGIVVLAPAAHETRVSRDAEASGLALQTLCVARSAAEEAALAFARSANEPGRALHAALRSRTGLMLPASRGRWPLPPAALAELRAPERGGATRRLVDAFRSGGDARRFQVSVDVDVQVVGSVEVLEPTEVAAAVAFRATATGAARGRTAIRTVECRQGMRVSRLALPWPFDAVGFFMRNPDLAPGPASGGTDWSGCSFFLAEDRDVVADLSRIAPSAAPADAAGRSSFLARFIKVGHDTTEHARVFDRAIAALTDEAYWERTCWFEVSSLDDLRELSPADTGPAIGRTGVVAMRGARSALHLDDEAVWGRGAEAGQLVIVARGAVQLGRIERSARDGEGPSLTVLARGPLAVDAGARVRANLVALAGLDVGAGASIEGTVFVDRGPVRLGAGARWLRSRPASAPYHVAMDPERVVHEAP